MRARNCALPARRVRDRRGALPFCPAQGAALALVPVSAASQSVRRSSLFPGWLKAQSSQFSCFNPGTWAKSAVLRVSNVALCAITMHAIFKSIVPQRTRSLW